jgi:hypothetical protein
MPRVVCKVAGIAVLPVWTLVLAAAMFGREESEPIVTLEAFLVLLALGSLLAVAWLVDNGVKRAYRAGAFHAQERSETYVRGMQDAFGGLHEVDLLRPAAPVTQIQRRHAP